MAPLRAALGVWCVLLLASACGDGRDAAPRSSARIARQDAEVVIVVDASLPPHDAGGGGPADAGGIGHDAMPVRDAIVVDDATPVDDGGDDGGDDAAPDATPDAGDCTPGEECRASTGDCDPAEHCGSDGMCPPDAYASWPTECRPQAGVCDVPEYCTGWSPDCPPDGYAGPWVECRAADEDVDCDAAEYCCGDSPECPDDVPAPDWTPCGDDEDPVTCGGPRHCEGGVCLSRPVTCGDTCPASACAADWGGCVTDGMPCDDGDLCTSGDHYEGGVCQGAPVTCGGDACQTGVCDPGTGACEPEDAPDGTPCGDDDDPCTLDACQDGACHAPADDGTACDDEDPCTEDSCQAGACHGDPLPEGSACDDGDECTSDTVCEDGACGGGESELPGHLCDDGNDCTYTDRCNFDGHCQGTPFADGAPGEPACSDGNACTQLDVCIGGQCTGLDPVQCTGGGACRIAGTCDPDTGACANSTAPDGAACDDGNQCTSGDVCDGGSCAGEAREGGCNDGNDCTVDDECSGGSCSGEAVPEPGPPPCPACGDYAEGECGDPWPVYCDDSESCSFGTTCSGGGCGGGDSLPDGSWCLDCEGCGMDSCDGGACGGGTSVACDPPPDDCHEEGIPDPCTGFCTYPVKVDYSECDDGNDCTEHDTCQAGVCKHGGDTDPECTFCEVANEAAQCDLALDDCWTGGTWMGIVPDPDGWYFTGRIIDENGVTDSGSISDYYVIGYDIEEADYDDPARPEVCPHGDHVDEGSVRPEADGKVYIGSTVVAFLAQPPGGRGRPRPAPPTPIERPKVEGFTRPSGGFEPTFPSDRQAWNGADHFQRYKDTDTAKGYQREHLVPGAMFPEWQDYKEAKTYMARGMAARPDAAAVPGGPAAEHSYHFIKHEVFENGVLLSGRLTTECVGLWEYRTTRTTGHTGRRSPGAPILDGRLVGGKALPNDVGRTVRELTNTGLGPAIELKAGGKYPAGMRPTLIEFLDQVKMAVRYAHGDGFPAGELSKRETLHFITAAEILADVLPAQAKWWPKKKDGSLVPLWKDRANGVISPEVWKAWNEIFIEKLPESAVGGHAPQPWTAKP